jgi:exodeoxyribonuclease VII small subunit
MPKAKGAEDACDNMENLPFEEALKKLEAIVEAMEGQDLPLEALLSKYAEGSRLVRSCQTRLNEAELKIQQLEKNARGEMALKAAAIENNARNQEKPGSE